MTAILGAILPLIVQLFTWWLGQKGKASKLDEKWLKWLQKKNEDSIQSAEVKKKIEAALKWLDDHPL